MKLEQLKAALAAATPGEWELSRHATPDYAPQFGVYAGGWSNDLAIVRGEGNADFIALAHNTMPLLLEAVEALEAIKARFDGVFDHFVLVKYGPLDVSMQRDMYRLADNALEKLK